ESSEEDNWEDDWIENPNPNNLGAGEAWWNLDSDEGYEEYNYEAGSLNNEWEEEIHTEEFTELIPPDLAVEEYEEIADLFDFYFDEGENLVMMYNVETLSKDQKEKIE
ncbi:25687_t:CDS:1, partial [Gigaspora rosea]